MEKNSNPKVLLITCCADKDTRYLLKGLQGLDDGESLDKTADVNCERGDDTLFSEFDWTLENKYYTADLNLVLPNIFSPTSEINELMDEVEAVVLSFEICDDTSFQKAKNWAKYCDDWDIDVKLLLAKDTEFLQQLSTVKERITEWCLENSFELVESYQTDERNEDFPEKFGFDRVKEALGTHMWPNMVRRSEKVTAKPANIPKADEIEDSQASKPTDVAASSSQNRFTNDTVHDGNEIELESFEEIFGKLQEMKLNAQAMSDEKRKEYAEQVTLAFWKAMGQDEDEIEGI